MTDSGLFMLTWTEPDGESGKLRSGLQTVLSVARDVLNDGGRIDSIEKTA